MDKKTPSITKHSIIAVSLFVVDAFILNQGIFSALIVGVSLISLMIMLVMLIFKKERDLLKRRVVIAVIYVIMALMVQGSNDLNNRIAMKRAGMIITACENYKGRHGAYPSKLSDLVPEFLNPCELESPGSRRGRNAEFAGGRVLEGSHRLLPVGAPLKFRRLNILLYEAISDTRPGETITICCLYGCLLSADRSIILRQRNGGILTNG